jgi:threonine dehydrogenase-like Zn-dependent dehydrogenase
LRAITFQNVHEVACERVPDPVIVDPGDVIVRVLRSAVCGSDLHVYHGRETGLDRGTVMGHEFLGDVVEAGSGVGAFRRGDRVVSPFSTACGKCDACRRGLSARCSAGALFGWVVAGSGLHGAQAEYVRVPLADSTLVAVPEALDLDVALLLGDVLPTGYYAARCAAIESGQTVAVLGCGPIGLAAILAAGTAGAGRIAAIDLIPERLAIAASYGAIPMTPTESEIARWRDRADVVLEAAGSPAASRLALELVRPGGTIAAVAVHNEPAFAFSPVQAYDKNLTYRTGRCPARSLMPELIGWMRAHADDLARMITHRLPLAAAADAYACFDAKREGCIKLLFDLEH